MPRTVARPITSCYGRNPDHKPGALVAEWISARLTVAAVANWAFAEGKAQRHMRQLQQVAEGH